MSIFSPYEISKSEKRKIMSLSYNNKKEKALNN